MMGKVARARIRDTNTNTNTNTKQYRCESCDDMAIFKNIDFLILLYNI
jgi:predicted SprT family Zn-dependent metalloprotease